jgi:hypothetical protein
MFDQPVNIPAGAGATDAVINDYMFLSFQLLLLAFSS